MYLHVQIRHFLQKQSYGKNGAEDIAAYWSELNFDCYPVVPIPVSCEGRPGDCLQSAAFIIDFVSAPVKDIRNNKHDLALELMKFAVCGDIFNNDETGNR